MRSSSVYVCQKCGRQSPKWVGQCPQCGEWNSLVETNVSTKRSRFKVKGSRVRKEKVKPLRLREVESMRFSRIKTGIGELDRVLGGGSPASEAGIVPGSVVLLAGEPGMGKSTLLTQLVLKVAGYHLTSSFE